MKKSALKITLILMFLLVVEFVFSQSTPPSPSRVPPPPGLPIDGGLFTLVAVAFSYGINKLRNKK